MNTQKLTKKSIEAIESAQSIAVANSNQQIDQPHILSALLEQEEGLIPQLLQAMGADVKAITADAAAAVDGLPKVTGSGARQAGSVYVTQDLDKALLQILGDTLKYLNSIDSPIDPMTQKTYEFYQGKE